MQDTLRVLVICQRNSCRSIMAEALFKKLGRGIIDVESAGSAPAEQLNRQTLGVLRRHGLGIGALRSKSWNEFSTTRFDLVITLCDRAANALYPLFPGKPEKLFWDIPDPLQQGSDDAETEAAIEETYLVLKKKIESFCREQRASQPVYAKQAAAG